MFNDTLCIWTLGINGLHHSVIQNFWPLCTDLMCLWRFPFCVALNAHCGHGNFLPSWTDFMCLWRFPFCVALNSHCWQLNFWPSWTDVMCVWRFPFCVALYSHCEHWCVLIVMSNTCLILILMTILSHFIKFNTMCILCKYPNESVWVYKIKWNILNKAIC